MGQNNLAVLTDKAINTVSDLRGSLSKLKETKQAITVRKDEIKKEKETLLLLDASYSMSDNDSNGISKMQTLGKMIKTMPNADKIYFNSDIMNYGKRTDTPQPGGAGTFLADAFKYIKSKSYTNIYKKIILISDGMPNSENEAIESALDLKKPINIIFIGDKGSDGERFMQRLAKATGGSNITLSEKSNNFSSQLINTSKQLLLA
jgi:hypothetical protein